MKVNLVILLLLLMVNSTYSQVKDSISHRFEELDPDWSGFQSYKCKPKKLPKEIKEMVRGIRLIEGGLLERNYPSFRLEDKDSAVVISALSSLQDFYNPARWHSSIEFSIDGDTDDNLEKELFNYSWRGNDPNSSVTVASFWMSDHEVTNKEYREFTDWVTESVARQILAEKYPEKYLTKDKSRLNVNTPIDWEDPHLVDKLFISSERGGQLLNKEMITYSFNLGYMISYESNDSIIDSLAIFPEPKIYGDFYMPNKNLKWDYFNNPKYDDFPVVGVSWLQAMAYCSWRTNRLNEAMLIHEKIIETPFFDDEEIRAYFEDEEHIIPDGLWFPPYRLPTMAEWEYAASGGKEQIDNTTHIESLLDEKGNYLYNFGYVKDENNYLLKGLDSDGAEVTAKVKSYPPNDYDMSDMRGNVSEWVLDGFNLKVDLENLNITSSDELSEVTTKVLKFIQENYETAHMTHELLSLKADRLAALTIRYLNYTQQKQELKMVKGGSWLDGPMYLNIFLNNAYPQDSKSMKIGFRIARENIGSPHISR